MPSACTASMGCCLHAAPLARSFEYCHPADAPGAAASQHLLQSVQTAMKELGSDSEDSSCIMARPPGQPPALQTIRPWSSPNPNAHPCASMPSQRRQHDADAHRIKVSPEAVSGCRKWDVQMSSPPSSARAMLSPVRPNALMSAMHSSEPDLQVSANVDMHGGGRELPWGPGSRGIQPSWCVRVAIFALNHSLGSLAGVQLDANCCQ